MTPNEIVDQAVDFLDRPDLAESLLRYFPQALRLAHSVQKFKRDIQVQYVPDPSVVEGNTTLGSTQLTRIRDIIGISSYAAYSTMGTAPNLFYQPSELQSSTFKNLSSGYAQTDYFGWAYAQGWVQLGSTVTVRGLNDQTKLLAVQAIVWPSWVYNGLAETYSTDSWIAELFPQILVDHLTIYGARRAQQADVLREAQSMLGLSQNQLIVEFTEDIYNGS